MSSLSSGHTQSPDSEDSSLTDFKINSTSLFRPLRNLGLRSHSADAPSDQSAVFTTADLEEEEAYFGDTETSKPRKKRVRKSRGSSTASPVNEAPFANPNTVVCVANIPDAAVGQDEPGTTGLPSMRYGIPSAQQLGIMRVLAAFTQPQVPQPRLPSDKACIVGDSASTRPNSPHESNDSCSSAGHAQRTSRFRSAAPLTVVSHTSTSVPVLPSGAPPRYTISGSAQSTLNALPPYTRGRRLTRDN
ncbi:hypothetical protein DFP73DRAFT_524695 [Morchella snyderi]|nr:hypothetical protein DFP73DRAFT_524695 [Morchella snyderi]